MVPKIRGLFKPKPSTMPATPIGGSPIGICTHAERSVSGRAFEQAQSLQRQGQLERAVELYGAVIDATPDRHEAYYKRANALNGLGRLQAALADYDRAISLEPFVRLCALQQRFSAGAAGATR